MCVSIHFYFPFRSWLNACHPPSPLLFSVPLVSIRLPRLWTIMCPVSVVLAQPALRAARKVMFITCTQSTFPLSLIPFFLPVLLCWWCARARQQPAASLSPPSLSWRCLRCLSCHLFSVSRCSCLFIQRFALLVLVRPAAVVLAENSRGRGRISMHSAEPLGRCVFCTLAVPTSPHFHVGKHKHTVS